jgi:Flp pilus assembly CpaE family ATPase
MGLKGTTLIAELRETVGLDESFFDSQMSTLIQNYSLNPETLELDQLREVLADFLQSLILEEEAQSDAKYA